MSLWATYPTHYREREVQAILTATRAGECVSIVGLSGAGKSNLLGFIAHTHAECVLIDYNRLTENESPLRLIRRALGEIAVVEDELTALDALIGKRIGEPHPRLVLLLDRFGVAARRDAAIHGQLRALRDAHKYALTYVTATRQPLDPHTELAELFFAHTFWLGPLNENDARWNITRYAERQGLAWDEATMRQLIEISGGYAAFLRAVCEAHAAGAPLQTEALRAHPAVAARVEELLADQPSEEDLRKSGLDLTGFLKPVRSDSKFDTTHFTAKELALFNYLHAHAKAVCAKDDLIKAVWPEDKIFEKGVRDDALAQLVRRLREKIEPDAAKPRHIQTVAGRGYRFME